MGINTSGRGENEHQSCTFRRSFVRDVERAAAERPEGLSLTPLEELFLAFMYYGLNEEEIELESSAAVRGFDHFKDCIDADHRSRARTKAKQQEKKEANEKLDEAVQKRLMEVLGL